MPGSIIERAEITPVHVMGRFAPLENCAERLRRCDSPHEIRVDQFWDAICTTEYLRAAPTMQQSRLLQPDQSVDVPMTINTSLWRFQWMGPQDQTLKAPAHLPVGKHHLTITRQIRTNPAEGKYSHQHWTGEIGSNPVDFEVVNKDAPATKPSAQGRQN